MKRATLPELRAAFARMLAAGQVARPRDVDAEDSVTTYRVTNLDTGEVREFRAESFANAAGVGARFLESGATGVMYFALDVDGESFHVLKVERKG